LQIDNTTDIDILDNVECTENDDDKSKKVLVLDLDNTLWGGVIGDDGITGLKLGQGSSQGEAYAAFQRYVLSLKQRGIVLAVSSKNTHSVAESAIRNHPEMILKMDDFTVFLANWKNKADNISEIAAALNL
jgi:FkbH-like protein